METEYFINKTLSADIRGDKNEAIAWRISFMKHKLAVDGVKQKHRKRAHSTIANLEQQQVGAL